MSTFGGGVPFLKEAVKAAKGGGQGRLLSAAQSSGMAPYLPERTAEIVLIHGGNLMKVVRQGVAKVQPGVEAMIPQIVAPDPVLMASGTTGNSAQAVFYVPNSLIKAVVGAVKPFLMGGMGARGGGQAPPDADF